MKKQKKYDDDDGRTIADMSDIEPMPLLVPKFGVNKEKKPPEPSPEEKKTEDERPWEDKGMSKNDRRTIVLGAMGATALIAGIFIAAGAAFIALFTSFIK